MCEFILYTGAGTIYMPHQLTLWLFYRTRFESARCLYHRGDSFMVISKQLDYSVVIPVFATFGASGRWCLTYGLQSQIWVFGWCSCTRLWKLILISDPTRHCFAGKNWKRSICFKQINHFCLFELPTRNENPFCNQSELAAIKTTVGRGYVLHFLSDLITMQNAENHVCRRIPTRCHNFITECTCRCSNYSHDPGDNNSSVEL